MSQKKTIRIKYTNSQNFKLRNTYRLDIERKDFSGSMSQDELQAHLIDTDPFIEMYCSTSDEDAYLSIYNLKLDTAAYNKLLKCIDEGTLESELGFVRLK